MPIASDPHARRTYILRSDRKKITDAASIAAAPTFFFRYLTRREKTAYLQLNSMTDEQLKALGADGLIDALYESLGTVLCGWNGLSTVFGCSVPYCPEKMESLDVVLTEGELWELYHAGASEISLEDRDFFALPPTSPPGESAPATPAAAVNPENPAAEISPPAATAPTNSPPTITNAQSVPVAPEAKPVAPEATFPLRVPSDPPPIPIARYAREPDDEP
jgi:hypothetical protein